ncbi:hypothetical protein [Cryobacterium sp. AP23]
MDDTLTAGWSDFAVALAGAAAALAGLVMVAISVNIREILALPGVTARAAAAVGSLVLVVVTAGLLLVPGQPAAVLGVELLATAALAITLHAVSLVKRMHPATVPRFTRGIAIPIAAGQLLPVVIGALLLVLTDGGGGGLYWVAAGLLLTIAGSMLDAWVLMVEILR